MIEEWEGGGGAGALWADVYGADVQFEKPVKD